VRPPILSSLARLSGWCHQHRRRLAFALLGGWLALIALSCATTGGRAGRTIVLPHQFPGATYIGSDACEQCHEGITRHFSSSAHARLVTQGPLEVDIGCESCHGPASTHVESGGAARTLIHPDRNPEACFQCHAHLRAEFSLPHRHGVADGRLGCSACHDPHRGDAFKSGGTALASLNEGCLTCHPSQRGPHVFEHEAVREGCLTCHQPHGSVNEKMLTARNAMLCLKCHFQQQTPAGRIVIGAFDHTAFLSRGTCWSAGCHEAVHGSQVSQSLRF
jgi:predicted CXXCH cytochrome family protein